MWPCTARERGLVNLDRFLGLASSVCTCRLCCTETNLGSDWSVMLVGGGPTIQIYIAGNGPRIVSKFTRPLFPRRGWGLGTRLDVYTYTESMKRRAGDGRTIHIYIYTFVL